MQQDILAFIDGQWCAGASKRFAPVVSPATGQAIARLALVDTADLDRALAAAERGFQVWRATSPLDRARLLRHAADILRGRAEEVARAMTLEQGKPLAESRAEVAGSADLLDWYAGEAQRTYGRVIPARNPAVRQLVIKEPVGPVAAFTPWNFPVSQAVRKVAPALAAGCSIILKGPEDTPGSCAAFVQALADAGVPAGVVNLVYGVPAEVSEYLIPHPVIRKISFTGSTAVGKHLAMLAGLHMKRATMELGGHSPVIVCEDADLDHAVRTLVAAKYRNAGQVCIAPTRFLVQETVYDRFVEDFVAGARAITVGDGLDAGTQMGPLASLRRVEAMEALVADAVAKGGRVRTGGSRIGNTGCFFEPTVLTDVPTDAVAMNDEPFGPVALMMPYRTLDDAFAEANRVTYGLASYAFTRATAKAQRIAAALEVGSLTVNHYGLALPEVPHGGVRDSGYGSEGGPEAMEAYLYNKFVTQME